MSGGNSLTFYSYYSNIFRSPRDASSPGSHRFEDALPAALEFKEESKYEINSELQIGGTRDKSRIIFHISL